MSVSTFDNTQILQVDADAAKHLLRYLQKSPKSIGVHIGVKDSGCSGYAYVLELTESEPHDTVRIDIENDLTLFVDVKSVPALSGSTLRLVKEGLNETIKFDNPNAGSYCGCGESFTVNPDVEAKLSA
ncbi:MAG TPA: iron-sulfur cluster assembly accessory protein [Spongiibacteraceae bacterium]|nr:iron-sulfur cluster assembly accessory protein [Spongiibacteraceae bacterium]